MPHRHLHLQRIATVAQVLSHKHGSFLANEQSRAVGVAADIIGADREISAFEAFDAVDVEAGVEDAVFHDGVAFFGGHAAGTETYVYILALSSVLRSGGKTYCAM